MHRKENYKFKIIHGKLYWKNDEMEKFIPVSSEVLTRVIELYESQVSEGIKIWDQFEKQGIRTTDEDPAFREFAKWMKSLRAIFSDTDPFREKERWTDNPVHLN